VTGYGQPDDKQQALRAGFDHHFVKPVNALQLLDLLHAYAAGQDSGAVP
jgi:CheY-like chemotaxis protein